MDSTTLAEEKVHKSRPHEMTQVTETWPLERFGRV